MQALALGFALAVGVSGSVEVAFERGAAAEGDDGYSVPCGYFDDAGDVFG